MADDINRREPMSAEEVLRTELIINQALIDILITKQFITEEELVGSIQNIKHEQERILKKPNKIVSFKR